MEGTSGGNLRKQLEEREAEVVELRARLEQADEEINRLRQENDQLRKELKAAGRGKPRGQSKRKAQRKRPGRKAGKGPFTYRGAPAAPADSEPPVEVPVTITVCPCCGGELRHERFDHVTVTDMPPQPQPEVKSFAVEVRRCERCGQRARGQHPDVAPDQYGATAHRVGPRVKAAAHVLHYGMGVPVRKLPAVVHEFTRIPITQSALTQDALKKAEGTIGNAYQELRASVPAAPVVYTDDTSWRIHGEGAHLMAFDTDQAAVFQIRRQHRNEEVRELIPADYQGVMVTDRGPSYEAKELLGVKQQKCLDHLNRNIDEVVETKKGPTRNFGTKRKGLMKEARQLWRDHRAGKADNYLARAGQIEEKITFHLRPRNLKDKDNQRLLDGIGLQHDRGNLVRFLDQPEVEPTNNRGERRIRFSVIVRGLSHGSKNERGAEAFSAFTSVIQTAVKRGVDSSIDTLKNLFISNQRAGPTQP